MQQSKRSRQTLTPNFSLRTPSERAARDNLDTAARPRAALFLPLLIAAALCFAVTVVGAILGC